MGSNVPAMDVLTAEERCVLQVLQDSGLHLKPGWIREALRIHSSGRGAGSPEIRTYQLALCSDLRETGTGCLPPNISGFENRLVQGKFVLQVDEIVDVSQSAEHRHGVINNRTLKMILTDGVQTLVGMEKKKLLDLDVNSCAGVKIVVQNFQVRRGIAMLRPENCCVLGGMEADLEKRRLKRLADDEGSRKRTQIVADAAPEDEDRIHGGSQMPSQQPPAQSRPRDGASVRGGIAGNNRVVAADALDLAAGVPDVHSSGIGYGSGGVSNGGGRGTAASAHFHQESTGGDLVDDDENAPGRVHVPVAMRHTPAQDPLRRSLNAQGVPRSVGSAGSADGGVDAGGGSRAQQGARGGAVYTGFAEEDCDALLAAAEERDDTEEDPAYQLMLEAEMTASPPICRPPNLRPHTHAAPRPLPAARSSPLLPVPRPWSGAEAIAGARGVETKAHVGLEETKSAVEKTEACGRASGVEDRHVTASVKASELDDGIDRDAGAAKNGTEAAFKAGDAASQCCTGQLQCASKVYTPPRALSVAEGPVKRSRDGSAAVNTPSPPHTSCTNSSASGVRDGGVGGSVACEAVAWQSLVEVRAMIKRGGGGANSSGGRRLVRIKGVVVSTVRLRKEDFSVEVKVMDGTATEVVLLTRPALQQIMQVNFEQFSGMSKKELKETKFYAKVSEALLRTEGIFIIDPSAGASTENESRSARTSGASEGAAPMSPSVAQHRALWHVLEIEPCSRQHARHMLARAQRCLDHCVQGMEEAPAAVSNAT